MSGENDDINSWRQAHLHLTLAIAQSRDNITKELSIRRYLLEELARCKAVTSSVTAPKKAAPKSKPSVGVKKPKEEETTKPKAVNKPLELPVNTDAVKKVIVPYKKGVDMKTRFDTTTVKVVKIQANPKPTVNKPLILPPKHPRL
jgi:hypothetical protein